MNEWIKITEEDKHRNSIRIPWKKKNKTCFIWYNGSMYNDYKIETCRSWNWYFEDDYIGDFRTNTIINIANGKNGWYNLQTMDVYGDEYYSDRSIDSYFAKMEMHKIIGHVCFINEEVEEERDNYGEWTGEYIRYITIIPISYVDAYCLYPDDYKDEDDGKETKND